METQTDLKPVRRAIEQFHSGQFAVMRPMLADDIVWRVPHTHPMSEDIIGADNVIAFFERVWRETNGTFRGEVVDLFRNERRVVAYMRITAERKGRRLDEKMISVWTHGPNGQIVERELFVDNCDASYRFWSH